MKPLEVPAVAVLVDAHGRRSTLPIVAWTATDGEPYRGMVVYRGDYLLADTLDGFTGYERVSGNTPNIGMDDVDLS